LAYFPSIPLSVYLPDFFNPNSRPMPQHAIPSSSTFHGDRLLIPNLQPAFSSWKQGINPLHGRVKQAVDARLTELLLSEDGGVEEDKQREQRRILERAKLEKVKAADIGLFAAG
jgi:hypothetical protein